MDKGPQLSQLAVVLPPKRQSLQYRVTTLAIALGTLPVLLIGVAGYLFASRSIDRQILAEKQQRTEIIADKLDNFLSNRQREVEALATNPIFTEAALRDRPVLKQQALNEFAASLQYFDSLILFDPAGNPVAQATTGQPFIGNYLDRDYFQQALKTGQPTINGPGLSPSSGILRVEFAVPIKNKATDNIIYVIRARVPGSQISQLFDIFESHQSVWHLVNAKGTIFAGAKEDYLAQPLDSYYPGVMELIQQEQNTIQVFANAREGNKKQLLSYVPVTLSNNFADKSIGALITADTALAFQSKNRLLRVFSLGTGTVVVVIGAIAAYMANLAIRPIQHLTQVAQQVTQGGNFNLRANVSTQDEIGLLASSLNQLIGSVGQYTNRLEQSQEVLEQQVQERTEQLNAIIDNLGDGLLVIDPTGVVIRSNPVLLNMFKLRGQNILGRPCAEIFETDLSALIARNQNNPTQLLIMDVELPGKGIGQALVTAVARDGSEVVPGGNFDSIVLIRDITAEKEIDQMKTDFISTVSHELRTPLTSVLGFAKLIQKKLEDVVLPAVNVETKKTKRAVRQVRENLGIIVSEGERLTSLINDVLDISKIEAGKIDWNIQPVDVSEIAEQAVSATSVLAQNSGLEMICDIEPGLPQVMCDRNRLVQVLINLLSNAIKFTSQGSVVCRVRRQETVVAISVIDTGIGLSADDLEKVFEKFVQVGRVLTDKPSGTGLGLPICKQIIEHHGGRIWAESALGHGSTFTFTLPLEEFSDPKDADRINLKTLVQELKSNMEQVVVPATNDQKTILVVDDEPHIRQLLRQELEAAGYSVKTAQDGMDALQQIKAEPPDLIILDVMMPNINGFDLAAVLKNNPATMKIPTIVLSIVQDPERGYRLGIDRYLNKPIDTPALLNDIKTLLDQEISNRQVLVVDMDTSTTKTLTEVLLSKGYTVTESTMGQDGFEQVLTLKPDMIIVDSAISMEHESMNTLQFNNGLENIFIIMVDQSQDKSPPSEEPELGN